MLELLLLCLYDLAHLGAFLGKLNVPSVRVPRAYVVVGIVIILMDCSLDVVSHYSCVQSQMPTNTRLLWDGKGTHGQLLTCVQQSNPWLVLNSQLALRGEI